MVNLVKYRAAARQYVNGSSRRGVTKAIRDIEFHGRTHGAKARIKFYTYPPDHATVAIGFRYRPQVGLSVPDALTMFSAAAKAAGKL